MLHVSSKKYIKEILRRYQEKFGTIPKQNIPIPTKSHPELDDSPFLDIIGHKEYQHIVGVCQWLVVAGRMDINYAVSSLSRFAAAPRHGHLDLARHLLGYLKKYTERGYMINPRDPNIPTQYENVEVKQDFGNQYQYFIEDVDPRFPEPLLPELSINIFVDSDHAHDKTTGRSITGILAMVGSTPTVWLSKRNGAVLTSTYGAEFTALKRAVEEAVTIRYHLRSSGVRVQQATNIWVDNMSVVLSSTNPGSPLNKKNVALAYHFVREHAANEVISIRKIQSTHNYADAFTKALDSTSFHNFFQQILCN